MLAGDVDAGALADVFVVSASARIMKPSAADVIDQDHVESVAPDSTSEIKGCRAARPPMERLLLPSSE